ncbi:MAG TPA: hypothetical protein VJI13_00215 [Candidatus Norongarragalinales archaeon]|nr:hypothetical protein [Candidatus Norongarragalinales archaeon]
MVTSLETLDDWLVVLWIAVPVLIILNMQFGLTYEFMLMPFRGIIPGFFGLDSILLVSGFIILMEKVWPKVGWLVTFGFVFGLIWLLG